MPAHRSTVRGAFSLLLILAQVVTPVASSAQQAASDQKVFGFRDFSKQAEWNKKFAGVPNAKLAEEHLRILTAEPHVAGSPEDKKTADYVAQKFREAGLETEIVSYKVWMNLPKEISVKITAPANLKMSGPAKERVDGDPFQDDPRVLTAFNGYSASGDVEADIVYANYGRPEDIAELKKLNIDLKGKILLVRYGANFRGVKTYVAEEAGAAGVIIYSDPIDDGYFKGDKYPKGPWRPDTAVQRGSVQYLFKAPGDPTTIGFPSTMDLPDSKRTPLDKLTNVGKTPTTPISYAQAKPILENLGGPESPRSWQGALPFTYHVGPGPVKVRMKLVQDYQYRTIWNVIGKIKGSELPDEWVIAGNHRDAWVYGAVDPNSGTAAMLEAVHGIGELLKQGWRPRRTMVFGSWDAEEQGLIGSTEWVEEHKDKLANAAAYFNMDVAVSGGKFGSSAVPSLKQFVRDVTKQVPEYNTDETVYAAWKKRVAEEQATSGNSGAPARSPNAKVDDDVPVGDLGSGSDYTPFLQHAGVPSTDIGSSGSYGVYHSVFDNFAWFKKFADPDFRFITRMARVYGVEMLHMANADVLPYDYKLYGEEIAQYAKNAERKAQTKWKDKGPDFKSLHAAAERFAKAGAAIRAHQDAAANANALNKALRDAERALLLPEGLPGRPWFKHAIYAPGEYTGYAAVVIPGVNEGIDANDAPRTQREMGRIVEALNRAATVLENFAAQAKM